ncbi:MAG: hypothetical protein R3C10_01275 [Pirellulales bacterium]
MTTTNAPWLEASDKLYRAHCAVCRWIASGKGKLLRLDEEFAGNASEYITRVIVEELEAVRQAGYLRLVETKCESSISDQQNPYQSPSETCSAYVLTFKGAYLMTWKELWPIRPLRTRHRIREGRRRLADAGFVVDNARM